MSVTNSDFITVNNMLAFAKLHRVDRVALVTQSPASNKIGIVVLLIGDISRLEFMKILVAARNAHGKPSKPNHVIESDGSAKVSLYLQWLEETDQNWAWSDLKMRFGLMNVSMACFTGIEMCNFVADKTQSFKQVLSE